MLCRNCGIFLDQGSNWCPLHCKADSSLLNHQGSPWCLYKRRRLGHRHPQRYDHVKTGRRWPSLSPGESLQRNQSCQHLDLGLLVSRIAKNKQKKVCCLSYPVSGALLQCSLSFTKSRDALGTPPMREQHSPYSAETGSA